MDSDPLEADSTKRAILIRDVGERVVAIGDPTKEEWLKADNAYGLDWMR
jgi:hypothetical protein